MSDRGALIYGFDNILRSYLGFWRDIQIFRSVVKGNNTGIAMMKAITEGQKGEKH